MICVARARECRIPISPRFSFKSVVAFVFLLYSFKSVLAFVFLLYSFKSVLAFVLTLLYSFKSVLAFVLALLYSFKSVFVSTACTKWCHSSLSCCVDYPKGIALCFPYAVSTQFQNADCGCLVWSSFLTP